MIKCQVFVALSIREIFAKVNGAAARFSLQWRTHAFKPAL
jgi:hypothetical protein